MPDDLEELEDAQSLAKVQPSLNLMYQVVPIFCNLQLFVIPNFLIENSGDQTQNGGGLGGGDVNRKPGKEMNPENQEA